MDLFLVNADTGQDIAPLTSGAVVDILDTPFLTVRAEGDADAVTFTDNDRVVRTDAAAPFTISPEAGEGYEPYPLTVGEHNLVATPDAGDPDSGTPVEVVFSVVAEGASPPEGEIDAEEQAVLDLADTYADTAAQQIQSLVAGMMGVFLRAETDSDEVERLRFRVIELTTQLAEAEIDAMAKDATIAALQTETADLTAQRDALQAKINAAVSALSE